MRFIASSIPGRLRLRAPGLRNPVQLENLRAAIAQWSAVLAVEANPTTGSLLIRYDAGKLSVERCEARALGLLGKLPGQSRTPKVGAGGTARVKANRWAKRGMLASLAVSLLLAAVGTKRWHTLAGALFLHALGVHLWAHRRHILK
jgi:hypothetical protein